MIEAKIREKEGRRGQRGGREGGDEGSDNGREKGGKGCMEMSRVRAGEKGGGGRENWAGGGG